MKYSFVLLALAGAAVLLYSCRKSDSRRCDGDVICTMDHRAVGVTLVNSTGGPAAVDSVQTTDRRGRILRSKSGHRVYGLFHSIWNGEKAAYVVDDGWVAGNQGEEIRVIFRGFRGNEVVFEENFTVGADCCHVYKEAGADRITVLE
jgi:hypothetical protein